MRLKTFGVLPIYPDEVKEYGIHDLITRNEDVFSLSPRDIITWAIWGDAKTRNWETAMRNSLAIHSVHDRIYAKRIIYPNVSSAWIRKVFFQEMKKWLYGNEETRNKFAGFRETIAPSILWDKIRVFVLEGI